MGCVSSRAHSEQRVVPLTEHTANHPTHPHPHPHPHTHTQSLQPIIPTHHPTTTTTTNDSPQRSRKVQVQVGSHPDLTKELDLAEFVNPTPLMSPRFIEQQLMVRCDAPTPKHIRHHLTTDTFPAGETEEEELQSSRRQLPHHTAGHTAQLQLTTAEDTPSVVVASTPQQSPKHKKAFSHGHALKVDAHSTTSAFNFPTHPHHHHQQQPSDLSKNSVRPAVHVKHNRHNSSHILDSHVHYQVRQNGGHTFCFHIETIKPSYLHGDQVTTLTTTTTTTTTTIKHVLTDATPQTHGGNGNAHPSMAPHQTAVHPSPRTDMLETAEFGLREGEYEDSDPLPDHLDSEEEEDLSDSEMEREEDETYDEEDDHFGSIEHSHKDSLMLYEESLVQNHLHSHNAESSFRKKKNTTNTSITHSTRKSRDTKPLRTDRLSSITHYPSVGHYSVSYSSKKEQDNLEVEQPHPLISPTANSNNHANTNTIHSRPSQKSNPMSQESSHVYLLSSHQNNGLSTLSIPSLHSTNSHTLYTTSNSKTTQFTLSVTPQATDKSTEVAQSIPADTIHQTQAAPKTLTTLTILTSDVMFESQAQSSLSSLSSNNTNTTSKLAPSLTQNPRIVHEHSSTPRGEDNSRLQPSLGKATENNVDNVSGGQLSLDGHSVSTLTNTTPITISLSANLYPSDHQGSSDKPVSVTETGIVDSRSKSIPVTTTTHLAFGEHTSPIIVIEDCCAHSHIPSIPSPSNTASRSVALHDDESREHSRARLRQAFRISSLAVEPLSHAHEEENCMSAHHTTMEDKNNRHSTEESIYWRSNQSSRRVSRDFSTQTVLLSSISSCSTESSTFILPLTQHGRGSLVLPKHQLKSTPQHALMSNKKHDRDSGTSLNSICSTTMAPASSTIRMQSPNILSLNSASYSSSFTSPTSSAIFSHHNMNTNYTARRISTHAP